jgi:hypothetical protein
MSNISLEEEKKLKEQMEAIEQSVSLEETYETILSILKDFIDTEEAEMKKIACWIIAASMKEAFETFPILYINAPMASGKSRLLKLLYEMIPNSLLTTNLTEAVLFRIPRTIGINALLIDEAETITNKERGNLKELLNACYKKGIRVMRMRKNPKSESYEVEEFEMYLPVAIANITGIEGVVESRCLTTILEKSNNIDIMRKMEIFSYDPRFKTVKSSLSSVGSVCRCNVSNIYINTCIALNKLNPIIHTTYPTQSYTSYTKLLEKVENINVIGRDLELWLPLFCVASEISEKALIDLIEIAKNDLVMKKETMVEDRDTTFLLFLFARLFRQRLVNDKTDDVYRVSELRQEFRDEEGIGKSDYWPSSEWVGRALKRMRLVRWKKRLARGMEVCLDYKKILDRLWKLGFDTEDLGKNIKEEEQPMKIEEVKE